MIKLSGFGILFVVLAGGIIYGIGYWKYQNSPEYRAERDLKKLEKKYAEDPYGGDTPEETLRLFIDALRKGDTDLAAKYFILDKQEEWKEDLAILQTKNLIDEMVSDLQNLKLTKKAEEEAFFTLTDENNIAISQLILYKNSKNNRWKITEL